MPPSFPSATTPPFTSGLFSSRHCVEKHQKKFGGDSDFRFLLASTTSLTACFVGSFGSVAIAGQSDLWFPSVSTSVTTSQQQTLGTLELFMPVLQSNDSVFFVDLRLDPEHIVDFRGSYGAGIRHIVNSELMVGAYGYFNNEVFMGTAFQGVTVGAEFATPQWDGHINYQFSLDNPMGAGAGGGAPVLSLAGNNLVALIDTTAFVPMDGVDAELGYTVKDGLGEGNSVRASGGVYHYFSNNIDFSFTGVKAGLEFEHKFGESAFAPRLSLGGEVRHDNFNKTGYSLQARLRIPLGGDGLFSNGNSAPDGEGDISTDGYLPNAGNTDSGLTKDRINQRVRATGIVTVQRGSQSQAIVIDAATNAAIGQFFFADDANTPGSGIFADPTTLDNAITNAGVGGYVVALENGLAGDINTAGSTLLANQSVLGGGSGVAVLVNGSPMTFTLPGTAGTINGTNAGAAVLTLADDNLIRNLTITGGSHGISGNGIANGTIDNVSLVSAGSDAIRLVNTTGTQAISNFSITGPGDDGIFLDGVAQATISNGSVDGAADQGIDLRESNATISSVIIGTNAAITNQGLLIRNSDTTDRTVTVNNVTIGSVTPGTTANIGSNALAVNSTGTGKLSLNLTGSNILRSTGSAMLTMTGGTADSLEIAFGDLQAEAGTLVPTIDIQGSLISPTSTSTVVRSGGAITVSGNGTGGGIRFDNTRFDADAGTAGDQQVAFGIMNIGQGAGAAKRVRGDGLSFLSPVGDLQISTLNIFNNLGTGLEVDTKIGGTTFNLDIGGGGVSTTNGAALFLDPLTGNINLSSVTSTGATALGTSSQVSSGNGIGVFIDGLTSLNANPALNIGTVSITGPTTAGIGIQNSSDLTFGTVNITLSQVNTQGVDFAGTSGNISFGTTTIDDVGSAAGQTGVDFSGATLNGAVTFESVSISGPSSSSDSVGVNLTGVQGNQMVSLGSSTTPSGGPSSILSGLHRGVVIDPTATVQFRFGDGESGSDTGSSIDVNGQAGAFTVDAGSGTLPASMFDFDDVTFGAGDAANFPIAPDAVIFVSTAGGTVTAGTNGLSTDVSTITVTAALAEADTDQTFVFVGDAGGAIDVVAGGTNGFVLDAGQSIDSFNDGNTITYGTILPTNITGNFGVTGGSVTANNVTASNSTGAATAVISGTAGNAIRNVDITVGGTSLAGIALAGTSAAATISNVAISGGGAYGITITGNSSAITLMDVDISNIGLGIKEQLGTGTGSISADGSSSITNTTTRAVDIDQSAADFNFAGTISETDASGAGISINQLSGAATFSGAVVLNTGNANGVSLTNNIGGTVAFSGGMDIDTTTGTGFTATGGGTVGVTGSGNTIDVTDALAFRADQAAINTTFATINGNRTGANSSIVDIDNADGSFTLNGGVMTTGVVGTSNYGAIDILQRDGAATRSLTVVINGISVTQDASVSAGADEFGVKAIVEGDDRLNISINNSTFKTEDHAVYLASSNSLLFVTGFANNVLLGDSTAFNPSFFNNGASFRGVIFDSDLSTPGLQTVNGGTFTAGTPTDMVSHGVIFSSGFTSNTINPTDGSQGTLSFTNYNVNSFGSGILLEGNQSLATFSTADGSIAAQFVSLGDGNGGPNLDVTLTSLTLNNGDSTDIPFSANGAAGSFAVTGATTLIANDVVFPIGGDNAFLALGTALDITNSSADFTFTTLDIQASAAGTPNPSEAFKAGTLSTGINLASNSGGFTVTGATTIASTREAGINITGTSGTISFGQTAIAGPDGAIPTFVNPATTNNFTLLGATTGAAHGIDINGTITGAISFADYDIALSTGNSTALDISGAIVNAGITFGDFDVTSVSSTGTIGVNLVGATGTGTVRIGDSVVAGASSTIAGVNEGLLFSSATVLNFIYGDGEGSTDTGSSINATTSIAHDGSGLPAGGTYNFQDVDVSVGTYANITGPTVFVFDQAGTSGTGTFADPGTALEAENATADVLVMIDSNVDGSSDNIDIVAQGVVSALNLDHGQVLIGLVSGQTIDVATLGASSGGGAPGSFQFTGLNTSTVITASGTIDTVLPTLYASAGVAVQMDGTGSVASAKIRSDASDGINMAANATGNIIFQDLEVLAPTGYAIDVAPAGGAQTLSLSNLVLQGSNLGGAGDKALRIAAPNGTITNFSDITVSSDSGGILINSGVTFDADTSTGTFEAVAGGTITLGSTGTRIAGDGLRLDGVLGSLDFTELNIFNESGTGLYVRDAAGKGGTFTLTNSGGTIDTTNGTAIDIDPVKTNLNFATVSSTNAGAAGGILLDTVDAIGGAGTNALTITNLTVTDSTASGITVKNSSGDYIFTNATISGADGHSISIVGGSSVLNFGAGGGGIIHDGSGAAVTVSGGHTGSLTFSDTITATNGTGLQFDNAQGSTYSFNNTVSLDGTSNSADTGIDIINGTAASFTFANTSITSPTGTALNIDNTGNAGLTWTAGTITQNRAASAIVINKHAGGIINLGGTIVANTATAKAIDLNNFGTVNFTGGGLDIDTTTGSGFTATGGGTVNVQGTGNTIRTTIGQALKILNTTIGALDVTFQSVTAGVGGGGATDNGIVVDTTGTLGGLHITGIGTTDGSGGSVDHRSGVNGSLTQGTAIYLNNTFDTQIANMTLAGTYSNHAILGTNLNTLTLNNVDVTGTSGDDVTADEGGVELNGIIGALTVTGGTYGGGMEDNFAINNTTGTLTANFTGVTFAANNTTTGDNGLQLVTSGTATGNLSVQGSTFTGGRSVQLFADIGGSGGGTVNIGGTTANSFSMNQLHLSGGGAIEVLATGISNTATVTTTVSNNTFLADTNTYEGDVLVFGTGSGFAGTHNITISSNRVGTNGVNASATNALEGSGDSAIVLSQNGTGTLNALVSNNQIFDYNASGIEIMYDAEGPSVPTGGNINVTITNNTIQDNVGTVGFANAPIFILGGDDVDACFDISGNTLSNPGGDEIVTDVIAPTGSNAIFAVVGLGPLTESGIDAHWTTNNGGASVDIQLDPDNSIQTSAGCIQP